MSDGGDGGGDDGGGGGGGYGGGGGGGYGGGGGGYGGSYGGGYGGNYTDPGTDPAEADRESARESARAEALGGLGGGGGSDRTTGTTDGSGATLGGDARDTANYGDKTDGSGATLGGDARDTAGYDGGGGFHENIGTDPATGEKYDRDTGATISTTFGGDARDTGNYDAPAPAQGGQEPGNQPAPDSQGQGAPAPATAPADEGPGTPALAVPGSFDAEQGLLPGAFDPATYAPGQPSRDQNFGDTPGIQGAIQGATTNAASVGPAANVSQAGGLSTNAVDSLNQGPGLGQAPAAGSVVGAGNLASALSGDTPVSQALGAASSQGYGVGETGPVQLTEAEKARAAGGVGETGPVAVAGQGGPSGLASLGAPAGVASDAPADQYANAITAQSANKIAGTGEDAISIAQQAMGAQTNPNMKLGGSEDVGPLPDEETTPTPPPGGTTAPDESFPSGVPSTLAMGQSGPTAAEIQAANLGMGLAAGAPANMALNMGKVAANDFGPGVKVLGVEVDGKPTTAPETPSYAQKDPMSFLMNEGFNDKPTFPLADNNVVFNAPSRTEMLGASNQGIAPGMTFENGQPKDLGNAAAAVPTLTSNQDKFLTGGSRVADATPNQGFGMGFDATNPNIPNLEGGVAPPYATSPEGTIVGWPERGFTVSGPQVAGPDLGNKAPDATKFTPDGKPAPSPGPGPAPEFAPAGQPAVQWGTIDPNRDFNPIDAAADKPPAPGPTPDTSKPAAGPVPAAQGGGVADQPAPSSTSFGPDVAKALNDADGGGGGNAPPAGHDIPLASQLLQPIPGGPVETPQTPQTPFPGFPNPGLGDQGNPAGNYNPEAGVYASQGRPGGPVPLDPAVIAALNNA